MTANLMVTAQEAAKLTGYKTAARFRRAVGRGIMPLPTDPCARPQLWSRVEIIAALSPKENQDSDVARLDKAMGL